MASSLKLSNVEVFYQECEFFKDWRLTNSKVLENVNDTLYQNCIFYEDVGVFLHDDLKKHIFDVIIFTDCSFEKRLKLNNSIFKSKVFNNAPELEFVASDIEVDNSIIESPFILNDVRINFLSLTNTNFKSKFELKEGKVKCAVINNSNFENIFDSFLTEYEIFECSKSIFYDFVGFEQCVFYSSRNSPAVVFKHSTFLSFISFRNAVFNLGLCLEEANFKEPPNFFNVQLEPGNPKLINTSRETLRIIKFSFDKSGNKIEANKFFVREMKRYLQELSEDKDNFNLPDRIVLKINNFISGFGQSYVRPIVLYLLTGIIYHLLTIGHNKGCLYKINSSFNAELSFISNFFNSFASSILPFSSFLRPGMEFLSLLFYIFFAVLTWQIIVSIKRHTNR